MSANTAYRRSRFIEGVLHRKSAAGIQFLQFQTVLFLHLCGKFQDELDGFDIRLRFKNQRTDMEMQSNNIQPANFERFGNCLLFQRQRKAEFAIEGAGGGVAVGMRVDTRCHSQQNVLFNTQFFSQFVQHFQLMKIIYDNAPDMVLQGQFQFMLRFIIAVEINLIHREIYCFGNAQFALGDNVQSQTFSSLMRRSRHAVGIGFAGINNERIRITLPELFFKLTAFGT